MSNISREIFLRGAVVTVFLLFFGFLFSACTPLSSQNQSMVPGPLPSSTQTDLYIIQAGDELEVDFYEDNVQDQKMDVRPDGFISLPLVGDVKADGLTVPELISELESRYSKELNNPRINVIIRRFNSNVVFIGGDVKEPSGIHFDGKITVLQAISLAGGYYPKTAIIDQVLVIRRQPGKPPQRFIVDLSKIIDGSDIGQDFYLYQYDTVYVPAKE